MKRQNKMIIRLKDTDEVIAVVEGYSKLDVMDKIAYAEQEDLSGGEDDWYTRRNKVCYRV